MGVDVTSVLICQKQLKQIGAAIDGLNKSCIAMRSHVTAANRETGPCLEEATDLMKQRQQTETKQQILNAFNTHFLLSEEEVSSLTSTAEPVTDAFFQALARVKRIHDDSQLLLGSEDQQLGLEILEQSSKRLNAAFQKLFRWTQKELRTLDLEDPQLSTAVRRALRALAERPALFQSCLDFFAENRERVLSDAFYAALTGGSAQSTGPALGKAIELNAHDPLRYVSDMLAWAHAATVGEREALHMLFISDADAISRSFKAGREREPWLQIGDGADGGESNASFDGKQALHEVVNKDLAGVLRQLRQRVEQIVHSHEDAMLAYQISNLVTFYCSVFSTLLGSDSSIVQILRPITEKAFEQFKTVTRDHIANIRGDAAATPSDMSPPEFLIEALQTLKGLMKSYDTSLANSSTNGKGVMEFEPVLEEALDPYLAGCDSITSSMSSPQGQTLAINCLLAAKSVLVGTSFTTSRLARIDESIREQSDRLVHVVHGWFLTESGLRPLMGDLEPFMNATLAGQEEEIRKLRSLQPERLVSMARQLDGFLPAALEEARAYVGQVDDRRLLGEICEQAADLFVEQYEAVEDLLTALDDMDMARRGHADEEEEEGGLLRDLFPRTSDELKVLLS